MTTPLPHPNSMNAVKGEEGFVGKLQYLIIAYLKHRLFTISGIPNGILMKDLKKKFPSEYFLTLQACKAKFPGIQNVEKRVTGIMKRERIPEVISLAYSIVGIYYGIFVKMPVSTPPLTNPS